MACQKTRYHQSQRDHSNTALIQPLPISSISLCRAAGFAAGQPSGLTARVGDAPHQPQPSREQSRHDSSPRSQLLTHCYQNGPDKLLLHLGLFLKQLFLTKVDCRAHTSIYLACEITEARGWADKFLTLSVP